MSSSGSDVIRVVGIGADGWSGLSAAARAALGEAEVVFGSPRHFALLDPAVTAERVPWPTPLVPALPDLLARHTGRKLAVVASGDPMYFGIGSTLERLVGAGRLEVHPATSSVSLACARLAWPREHVEVVSLTGRPVSNLQPLIQPHARVLALVPDGGGAAAVCDVLADCGFSSSTVTVLENLGGPDERIVQYDMDSRDRHADLAIVAIDCMADPDALVLPRTPGLPDFVFEFDRGQITKREIRALVLAELRPVPGELLWDIGAGSGSIGIEWMRTAPTSRTIAIEPRADRCERIRVNAQALGVPTLQVVEGKAPEALAGLEAPDAIFIGGGATTPQLIETALAALATSGRLVVNGVTIETEAVLARWHAELGGRLVRIAVQRAAPVGGFTGWRPGMPVTQWSYRKDHS